ncbi:DUF1611 domain-containing protein [Sinorhizobium meliloti]|uniref:N-acetyltransferase DgcN n=1 Tax=Rhizobium meliloti TaxID=382 RepID=UPI001294B8FD|nr:N-acetyltransferase DgcN [Sinorhizobium meliloti]MQW08938.1 DUF1611 domain-containing protein [Sinorhizobium meliloti]
MELKRPFLLFLGDAADDLTVKTAAGIVDWRKSWCVGQWRLSGCKADVHLDDMSPSDAKAQGAETMIVGVANSGGILKESWVSSIVEALEAGLDVASGLHVKLEAFPAIAAAAKRTGRSLHNVRIPDRTFLTGMGTKRRGRRLLTVGTDCCVGKKYTALSLEAAMRAKGWDADFRATGQTGIFISGRGVAVDAVLADFISGAAEWISPDAETDSHWDVIEGQGSLLHPGFAGVSLGLLHGSQPDVFVVCHEPTRKTMRGVQAPIPAIRDVINLTIACGRLTNPNIKCVGIAANTQALDEKEARDYLAFLTSEYDLPATDPLRFGVDVILERIQYEA